RDAEDDSLVTERLGDGQRGDEHRGNRGEHGTQHHPFVRIERVREPGICRPGPPQRGQNEEALPEPRPGRVVREQRRHLGEPEHEHEVEEELERCDRALGLGGSLTHGSTLYRCAPAVDQSKSYSRPVWSASEARSACLSFHIRPKTAPAWRQTPKPTRNVISA